MKFIKKTFNFLLLLILFGFILSILRVPLLNTLTYFIDRQTTSSSIVEETASQETSQSTLTTTNQTVSITNIEIGQSKADVEAIYGFPKSTTLNEYGVYWNTYHQNYQNFFMVAYNQEDTVVGLFTNQDLIASDKNLAFGTEKAAVRAAFGNPETEIRKGLAIFLIESNREYDVFHIDDSFITVFYDLHDNQTVTAVQIIHEDLEFSKTTLYKSASTELTTGFERQLFDLTNATRVKHGLSILEWSNQAQLTAQKHSQDMAENNFFDHINLQGQSPFDRMTADNILYVLAGENLATGQTSSIFAHQGLMNSEGHREIILTADVQNLGIGVAFNQSDQPYYTALFYL